MTAAVARIHPAFSVPGGRVVLHGSDLPLAADGPPRVTVGQLPAHVASASRDTLRLVVPPASAGGSLDVRIDGADALSVSITVGRQLTSGIHQVDNPVFDAEGRLYVTHSGGRGVKVPVPLYRVGRDGVREPLSVEIPNPTSLALGPDGAIYVSSRFEGSVYRLMPDDRVELYAAELGVATGLAFGEGGTLFVGDRSGSILRISPDRQVDAYATLPPSVAAFHLAFGPDGCLYVAAPTLASRDSIYRITPDRIVDTLGVAFGRPQGLAFDARGRLHVVEAMAGGAGLYRVDIAENASRAELIVGAPALVGVAFDPHGGLVLASGDTVWRLDVELP